METSMTRGTVLTKSKVNYQPILESVERTVLKTAPAVDGNTINIKSTGR